MAAAAVVANWLAESSDTEMAKDFGDDPRAEIVMRVQSVFGSDAQSADALEDVRQDRSPAAVDALASALTWYAQREPSFAEDLVDWAGQARTEALSNWE